MTRQEFELQLRLLNFNKLVGVYALLKPAYRIVINSQINKKSLKLIHVSPNFKETLFYPKNDLKQAISKIVEIIYKRESNENI
jgi:hypothetical protein